MLNIKFLKTICQISASSYKQLRSYKHFKIYAYISLEGRMAAAEMLLILKLDFSRTKIYSKQLFFFWLWYLNITHYDRWVSLSSKHNKFSLCGIVAFMNVITIEVFPTRIW